jgi:hypothetical protein
MMVNVEVIDPERKKQIIDRLQDFKNESKPIM